MTSILDMCRNMITELKGEIDTEEDNKQHCMDETHKHEMNVIAKKGDLEQAIIELADLDSQLEYNQKEIDTANKAKRANVAAKNHLTEQCNSIEATLIAQIGLLTTDIAGVEDAIVELEKAFGVDAMANLKDHETHTAKYNDKFDSMEGDADVRDQKTDFSNAKKRRGGGVVIVELLKQILGSLKNNKLASQKEKISSQQECIQGHTDLDNEKMAIGQELSALDTQRSGLTTDRANAKSAKDDADTELGTALQNQSDFGNCATKLEVYDNAIAAKNADIQGLIAVISTLESISKGTVGSLAL